MKKIAIAIGLALGLISSSLDMEQRIKKPKDNAGESVRRLLKYRITYAITIKSPTPPVEEIESTLEEKDAEIEQLAESLYQQHSCRDEQGNLLEREVLLYFIATDTRYVERELHTTLHQSKIHIDLLDQWNVGSMLAIARSYERCLSEKGIVDMYRDLQREIEYGHCDEAENLAKIVDDTRSVFRVARTCNDNDGFYERVEQSSEEELPVAAEFVEWDHFDRYQESCSYARRQGGESESEAAAVCAADFAYSRLEYDSLFFFPSSDVSTIDQMLRSISPIDQKRVCTLETARARWLFEQGIPPIPDAGTFSAFDYFRRCMEE